MSKFSNKINLTFRVLMMNTFMTTLLFWQCNHQEKIITISKEFCIDNSNAAVNLAEKEWLKTYGKNIYQYQPFKVRLENDSIWVVYGTLPSGYVGGTPQARINAKTCEIIQIIHSK